MSILIGQSLCFSVGNKALIDNIDIAINAGEFLAIIGPNGAGKTTLLNLIDGDVKPHRGQVQLNGESLSTINRLQLAKTRAVLPQLGQVPFTIKARDIVALGREPYRYETEQTHSEYVINDCLTKMDITHLATNNYATLSGGEQHRVQIARTLAQIFHTTNANLSGKVLFLDEPTNHLDIRHQYTLMRLLKSLQDRGLTVISVMHELSLALQFSEQIILLNAGKKVGQYTPDELVESRKLSEVYQMQMNIKWDAEMTRYVLMPTL